MKRPRLTDDERAQAVDLYNAGLTLTQVSDRIRRSVYAVRTALVDAGVPRRLRNQRTITDAEHAEVVRLYTVERLSTHAIADRLGRAQSGVWKILAHAGVPRRASDWPKDAASRRQDRAGAR